VGLTWRRGSESLSYGYISRRTAHVFSKNQAESGLIRFYRFGARFGAYDFCMNEVKWVFRLTLTMLLPPNADAVIVSAIGR
jgi:hypothetical protein